MVNWDSLIAATAMSRSDSFQSYRSDYLQSFPFVNRKNDIFFPLPRRLV